MKCTDPWKSASSVELSHRRDWLWPGRPVFDSR